MEKESKIEDKRDKSFMIYDEYIDKMAKQCGWKGSIVYQSLCRHANKEGSCFPSLKLVAKQHEVSKPTILRGLESLVEHNVIKIKKTQKKDGSFLNNFYIINHSNKWRYISKPPLVKEVYHPKRVTESTSFTTPSKGGLPPLVKEVYPKETHMKETHMKETHQGADAPVLTKNLEKKKPIKKEGKSKLVKKISSPGFEINAAIEILSSLNPDWRSWYKPGAMRTSVSKLLKFCKEDGNDLKQLVDKVIANRGQQYEVQIYNPCDMVEKYAKLITKKRGTTGLSSENIVTLGRYDKENEELKKLKEKKEEEYRLSKLQINKK